MICRTKCILEAFSSEDFLWYLFSLICKYWSLICITCWFGFYLGFSYPPAREKCAGPSCMNTYKYRDSKSKLPLCSLQCYKALHEKIQPLSAWWTELLHPWYWWTLRLFCKDSSGNYRRNGCVPYHLLILLSYSSWHNLWLQLKFIVGRRYWQLHLVDPFRIIVPMLHLPRY